MRKTRISEWPEVRAFVHPDTKANLQAHAEDRALDVADLVREALDKAYRAPRPAEGRWSPSGVFLPGPLPTPYGLPEALLVAPRGIALSSPSVHPNV